jgi:TolA-binding protein
MIRSWTGSVASKFHKPEAQAKESDAIAKTDVPSLALQACGGAILAVLLGAAAFAQERQNKARPADADLLQELESDLLKGLPAARKAAPKKDLSPDDQRLQDDLKAGEDLSAAPENPLLEIGRQMRAVERRIAQRDTSQETQSDQGKIVAALQKLLEQATQQEGNASNSASGRGTGKAGAGDGQAQPGAPQESTDRVGGPQTEAAQTADVRNLLQRIWGHLPEKMRDEMRNAVSDQFLPKYEKLIEEYYQRLADERSSP